MSDISTGYYCPLLPSRLFKALAGTNTPPSKIVVGRRKSISDPDAAAVLYFAASVVEYRKFAHDYFTKAVMEKLCPGDIDTYLDETMTSLNYPTISYNAAYTLSNDPKFQAQKSYTQSQQQEPKNHGREINVSSREPCFLFMEDRYGVTPEQIFEFLDFLEPYRGRAFIAHPVLVNLFDADY